MRMATFASITSIPSTSSLNLKLKEGFPLLFPLLFRSIGSCAELLYSLKLVCSAGGSGQRSAAASGAA